MTRIRYGYVFNVSSLPPDIFFKIADYLDMHSRFTFAFTCKYFQLITRIPSLWFDIRWVTNRDQVDFSSMQYALKCNGEHVRKLSLTGLIERKSPSF